MPSKVWGEITYQFPNFNGAAVEIWEWTRNFIPHFIMDVITYPMPCCPAGYIGVLAELIIAESTEYLMNIRSTQEARDEIHNLRHSKPKVWKVTGPQHSSSTSNSRSESPQNLASFTHSKLQYKVIEPFHFYYTTDPRSEMLRIGMRAHSSGLISVNDNDNSNNKYNDNDKGL